MTINQHLITILAEECAEVTHRVSKALRFGFNEVQPEQKLNNAERIALELCDLVAIIDMLHENGIIPFKGFAAINDKKNKVIHFLEYSKKLGLLTE